VVVELAGIEPASSPYVAPRIGARCEIGVNSAASHDTAKHR